MVSTRTIKYSCSAFSRSIVFAILVCAGVAIHPSGQASHTMDSRSPFGVGLSPSKLDFCFSELLEGQCEVFDGVQMEEPLVQVEADTSPMVSSGVQVDEGNRVIIERGTSPVVFEERRKDDADGGAISCWEFACVANTAPVAFSGNLALSGGAIFAQEYLSLMGNTGALEFAKNRALSSVYGGGALATLGRAEISNNLELHLVGNESVQSGGALFANHGVLSESAKACMFKDNTAAGVGGAICANSLKISDNFGLVLFEGNQSGLGGGAISTDSPYRLPGEDCFVEVMDNAGSVQFIRNVCVTDSLERKEAFGGGAIQGDYVGLKDNTGALLFQGNVVRCDELSGDFVGGGAILARHSVDVSGNMSTVSFVENGKNVFSSTEVAVSSADLGRRGGGAILAESIDMYHNSNLVFSNNLFVVSGPKQSAHLSIGGGALFGTRIVNLSGNGRLSFHNNYVSGLGSSGGAILGDEVNIYENGDTVFSKNISQHLGGAICALKGPICLGHNTSLSFSNNRSVLGGGALAGLDAVQVFGNQGNVEFRDNIALDYRILDEEGGRLCSGGGAIFAREAVDICENQQSVLFLGNASSGFGGAILTGAIDDTGIIQPLESGYVTISGNRGDVIFSGNAVSVEGTCLKDFGGGAIYTRHLSIVENYGNVLFHNNVAPLGGAVYIADQGTLSLRAVGGDIVFQGNRDGEGKSKGLYFAGKNSCIMELSACKGRSIAICDAVEFEDSSYRDPGNGLALALVLNRKDQDREYVGTIRFASEVSKIPQVAHLQQGTLAIADRAQLWLAGFQQDPGSQLLLSAGTVFRIYNPSLAEAVSKEAKSLGGDVYCASLGDKQLKIYQPIFDLNAVSVDLTSFTPDEQGVVPEPPRVVLPEGVSLSGRTLDLVLVDSLGSGYENHELLSHERDISLIAFQTATADGIPAALDDVDIKIFTPTMTENTYGHVGVWSEARVEGGNLVVGWKPEGYRLNPEKRGIIIANTLWGQVDSLRAVSQHTYAHNLTMQRMDFDFSTNVWSTTFGVISDYTPMDGEGFSHCYGGVSIGIDSQLVEDSTLGFSFTQLIGRTKSQDYSAHSDQLGYVGSLYFALSTDHLMAKTMVLLGELRNESVTDFGSLGKTKGKWTNRGMMLSSAVHFPIMFTRHAWFSTVVSGITPYVQADFFIERLPGIQEQGKEARSFGEGILQVLSFPIGLNLEHSYARGQRSEVCSLGCSYSMGVVVNNHAEILVDLEQAGYQWTISPAALSRHMFTVDLHNNTEWNSYFGSYLGGSYSWKEDASSYQFDVGLKIIF